MSGSWLRIVVALGVAAVVFGLFLAVEYVLRRVLRRLGQRATVLGELAEHIHAPLRWFGAMVVLRITVLVALPTGSWRNVTSHVLTLALIGTGAWLLAGVLTAVEQTMLGRWRVDVADNRHARRMQTQIRLVRRVIVAAIAVIALGAMLMTFPGCARRAPACWPPPVSSARSPRWPRSHCWATCSPVCRSRSATPSGWTTS
ncbi:hypothetical protein [Amycolatopsis thermoflava]|uniref:hypothetical protein n=1 Tax=Amycolatopsis thermoflava TaxID=84480 RepID=UPI003F4A1E0F